MKVYAFQHTSCIYESSFETMSLHKTPKGAYKSMKSHLLDDYNEWRESGITRGKQMFKHGEFEAWRVKTIKLEL